MQTNHTLEDMAKAYAEANNVTLARAYNEVAKTEEGARLYAESLVVKEPPPIETLGKVYSKRNADADLDTLAKAHAREYGLSFAKAYDAVLQTDEGRRLYRKSLG